MPTSRIGCFTTMAEAILEALSYDRAEMSDGVTNRPARMRLDAINNAVR